MTIEARNPTTGTVVQEYPEPAHAEVAEALEEAHEAFLEWRLRPILERAEWMMGAATVLREIAETRAELARRRHAAVGNAGAQAGAIEGRGALPSSVAALRAVED